MFVFFAKAPPPAVRDHTPVVLLVILILILGVALIWGCVTRIREWLAYRRTRPYPEIPRGAGLLKFKRHLPRVVGWNPHRVNYFFIPFGWYLILHLQVEAQPYQFWGPAPDAHGITMFVRGGQWWGRIDGIDGPEEVLVDWEADWIYVVYDWHGYSESRAAELATH